MSEADSGPESSLFPEDEARASFYALLARLYSAPPDAALLAAIADAAPLEAVDHGDGSQSYLASAWDALRAASATNIASPAAIAEEFQTLFIGVGRSEVSLYASHYLAPQSGRPLAAIRAALAELGLARQPESSELEDHLAILLETMRMLVSGRTPRSAATIAQQQAFFDRHIAPWAGDCCTAIEQSPVAIYYRRVGQFTYYFLMLERESLAMG